MNKFWKGLIVVGVYALLAYVLTVDVSARQDSLTNAIEKVGTVVASGNSDNN